MVGKLGYNAATGGATPGGLVGSGGFSSQGGNYSINAPVSQVGPGGRGYNSPGFTGGVVGGTQAGGVVNTAVLAAPLPVVVKPVLSAPLLAVEGPASFLAGQTPRVQQDKDNPNQFTSSARTETTTGLSGFRSAMLGGIEGQIRSGNQDIAKAIQTGNYGPLLQEKGSSNQKAAFTAGIVGSATALKNNPVDALNPFNILSSSERALAQMELAGPQARASAAGGLAFSGLLSEAGEAAVKSSPLSYSKVQLPSGIEDTGVSQARNEYNLQTGRITPDEFNSINKQIQGGGLPKYTTAYEGLISTLGGKVRPLVVRGETGGITFLKYPPVEQTPVLMQLSKSLTPQIAGNAAFGPSSAAETAFLTRPEALKAAKVTEAGQSKVALINELNSALQGTPSKLGSGLFPGETKYLNSEQTTAALSYIKSNVGQVDKLYGSFATNPQLPTEFQRVPGDIEVQLKTSSKPEAIAFAQGLASELKKAGADVKVKGVTIEINGNTAIDIHYVKEPEASGVVSASANTGQRYGINLNQRTMQVEKLPIFSLSEQFGRKSTATGYFFQGKDNSIVVEPPLQRAKDIVDTYTTGKVLAQNALDTGRISQTEFNSINKKLETLKNLPYGEALSGEKATRFQNELQLRLEELQKGFKVELPLQEQEKILSQTPKSNNLFTSAGTSKLSSSANIYPSTDATSLSLSPGKSISSKQASIGINYNYLSGFSSTPTKGTSSSINLPSPNQPSGNYFLGFGSPSNRPSSSSPPIPPITPSPNIIPPPPSPPNGSPGSYSGGYYQQSIYPPYYPGGGSKQYPNKPGNNFYGSTTKKLKEKGEPGFFVFGRRHGKEFSLFPKALPLSEARTAGEQFALGGLGQTIRFAATGMEAEGGFFKPTPQGEIEKYFRTPKPTSKLNQPFTFIERNPLGTRAEVTEIQGARAAKAKPKSFFSILDFRR